MQKILVVLVVLFTACTSNNKTGETKKLSSLDSNTANKASVLNTDQLLIQSFTQIPSVTNNCNAVFVKDTSLAGSKEYYFVTDLKGTAFLKINNRLMELKLVKQTNIGKYTVNELYINDEVEVDLKINQFKEPANSSWNYKGVIIIRRGNKNEAISISGKLGC